MRTSAPSTQTIYLHAILDGSADITSFPPNMITGFDLNLIEGGIVELSTDDTFHIGGDDGKIVIIDAIKVPAPKGYQDAFAVRLKDSEMGDETAEIIGKAIKAYLNFFRTFTEFATAASRYLREGNWKTYLFLHDEQGDWTIADLGKTSVQISKNGLFTILSSEGRIVRIAADTLVDTLRDDDRLASLLAQGTPLEGEGLYLLRAPTGITVVVGDKDGLTTVYGDMYSVIAAGTVGTIVLPSIDEEGHLTPDKVTTVGKDKDGGGGWTVTANIPATMANLGCLAKAYGAQEATY